jgi:hypothetical protein
MAVEERVVVIVRPRVSKSAVPGHYFAEIDQLGLWAYGTNRREAFANVVHAFAIAVQARRKMGRLVPWLERSGLEWYWRKDYAKPSPVIDADTKPTDAATAERELSMAA